MESKSPNPQKELKSGRSYLTVGFRLSDAPKLLPSLLYVVVRAKLL